MTLVSPPVPLSCPTWVDRGEWPHPPLTHHHRDGRLHFVDVGSGPPVVLVHGTPTWSFEWRHVIAALAPTHRVLAMDHLGFGLSERPADAEYTPAAHAARWAAWIEARVPASEAVTLIVHDYGGPIALPWAHAHPSRVSRLVVVNSWGWSMAEDPTFRRQAALLQGPLGRFLYRRANLSLRGLLPLGWARRGALTRAVHRQYLAPFRTAEDRERVLYQLALAFRDSAPFFAALWNDRGRLASVPMHVIWGTGDRLLPRNAPWQWLEGYPHATHTLLDGVGHWPHDEAPSRFVAALEIVLKRR